MKRSPFFFLCCMPTASILADACCKNCRCQVTRVEAVVTDKKQNAQDADTKKVIEQAYGKVAEQGCSCNVLGGGCCGGGKDLSQLVGYTAEQLDAVPEANLGLGCGNPVMLGQIKKGWTVLDLGSGAGFDCFLAARKVGLSGKVVGVDMTEAMINKARENAIKYKFNNVEFRLGDIEKLPVESASVDLIISNCVINLAPNKHKVFQEAHRVLKTGGKMYVSDVVLLSPLASDQKRDPKLLCACVSGAMLKNDYLGELKTVGFDVEIVGEDRTINKIWFNDDSLPIASLKFIAKKK